MEAGRNDGISDPFLLFFMALTAAKVEGGFASLVEFIVEQLGFGGLIGLVIGLLGGALLDIARRRHWIAETFQRIGLVALPVLCMLVSEMIDARMFIASFVAGLAVQSRFEEARTPAVEFAGEWGQP